MPKCNNELCLSLATKGVYLIKNNGKDLVSASGCPVVRFSLTNSTDSWFLVNDATQLSGNIDVYINDMLVQVLPYLGTVGFTNNETLNCGSDWSHLSCRKGYYVGSKDILYPVFLLSPFGNKCKFSIGLTFGGNVGRTSHAICDISQVKQLICQGSVTFASYINS